MKIGILGGTFDPPHHGHLHLARAAQAQLGLRRVLWVLTADPPHKQANPLTPVADREAMVSAAIAGEPAFGLSRVDIDRPGPHWAADTVALLAGQHPGDELVYLMGGDSLRDLPTWGRPAEFLRYCRLGVLRRPGDSIDLNALEHSLPGLAGKVEFIDAPALEVASHELRQRLRTGAPAGDLMPDAVMTVIRARGLYREAGS